MSRDMSPALDARWLTILKLTKVNLGVLRSQSPAPCSLCPLVPRNSTVALIFSAVIGHGYQHLQDSSGRSTPGHVSHRLVKESSDKGAISQPLLIPRWLRGRAQMGTQGCSKQAHPLSISLVLGFRYLGGAHSPQTLPNFQLATFKTFHMVSGWLHLCS